MQLSLLDQLPAAPDPAFRNLRRRELSGGAWVDHVPDWLSGHSEVLSEMVATCDWQEHRVQMYDRIVEMPRLAAAAPGSSDLLRWDESEVKVKRTRCGSKRVQSASQRLDELSALLSHHYRRRLSHISLGYYRDGRDSVAFHGDKLGGLRSNTVVAIVSVGARRRFALRPFGGKTEHSFQFGGGDLLVMGGSCQETWEHAVPKMASSGPRVAIMFREQIPVARPSLVRAHKMGTRRVA